MHVREFRATRNAACCNGRRAALPRVATGDVAARRQSAALCVQSSRRSARTPRRRRRGTARRSSKHGLQGVPWVLYGQCGYSSTQRAGRSALRTSAALSPSRVSGVPRGGTGSTKRNRRRWAATAGTPVWANRATALGWTDRRAPRLKPVQHAEGQRPSTSTALRPAPAARGCDAGRAG
jgi:hypothetical protein